LEGTTIKLTAYELPFPQASKHGGDIGRAWLDYNDPEPFAFWLSQLPRLDIPEPQPIHQTGPGAYVETFGEMDPLAPIRAQIADAFGVEIFGSKGFGVKPNGKSLGLLCPFHKDTDPSASLHQVKGLYCHTEHKWYTWKDLARELGIAWQFETRTPAPEYTEAAAPSVTGMSRAERRAFIAAGFTNMARALDVLIDQERGGEIVTFAELRNILLPFMADRSVRNVFDNLRGLKLPNEQAGEFLTLFTPSSSLQHSEGTKTVKNSKRGRLEGRPRKTARIPTRAEIAKAANVVPDVCYLMTVEQIRSAAEYRAACMADEIWRKPGKYARKQLTAPMGIKSNSTIKAYCERVGIVRTPQPPKLVELTPAQVLELPENHRARRLMIAQKKIKPNAYMVDERGTRHELTQAGALHAAAMGGGKLYRAEYQASDYRRKGDTR
jgi:hypothetical protein